MGAKQSVKRWGKIIVVGGLWSTESLLESFNGDRSVSKVHTFTIDGERFRVLVKSDLSPENALKLHIRSYSGLKLYSGNVGVMLPYDVTDEASFEAVKRLGIHPDPFLKREASDIPKVLVGCQCQEKSKRQVSYYTAREHADVRGIPVVEVCEKKGINVELAFMTLVGEMLSKNVFEYYDH